MEIHGQKQSSTEKESSGWESKGGELKVMYERVFDLMSQRVTLSESLSERMNE